MRRGERTRDGEMFGGGQVDRALGGQRKQELLLRGLQEFKHRDFNACLTSQRYLHPFLQHITGQNIPKNISMLDVELTNETCDSGARSSPQP